MKNLIVAFIFVAALSSCKTEDNGFVFDETRMVNIRAGQETNSGVMRSAYRFNTHLSPYEIVTQTNSIKFTRFDRPWGRGFADAQRDTVNMMLKMWGFDIIDQDGVLIDEFIEAEDVILVRIFFTPYGTNDTIRCDPERRIVEGAYDKVFLDTIAYIPNETLRNAETRIRNYYDQKDYESIYRLFDSTYVFIPVTGSEWRELKSQNLQ